MNEKMRKALGFLGLVEDDYNEYAATEAPRPFSEDVRDEPSWAPRPSAPQRPSPPQRASAPTRVASAPTPLRAQSAPAPSSRPSSISLLDGGQPLPRPRPAPVPPGAGRNVGTFVDERDIEIMTPLEFNECQRITDQLRLSRSVILVVTQCGPAVARRLIDFAAGTAYAMRATVETLEKGAVYAICPHGVNLSPEVRARLVTSNYTSVGY